VARTEEARDIARSRWTLVGVGALFVGPLLLAWMLFGTRELWWSGATGNYGELVTPARPVQLRGLATFTHDPLDERLLQGHWTLVILGHDPRDARCRESLYITRQVRTALEKDQSRIQRLLVLTKWPPAAVRAELARIDPALVVATASAGSLARIREELAPGTDEAVQGFVYLVDPLGNLMMRYPEGADGKRMLKDLRRLLKVSQIG
jgi:hypothetical protein